MRTGLTLLALLLLCGCRTDAAAPAAPAPGNDDPTPVASATSAAPSFVGKAWVGEGSGDLPGVLRIFLPDGTLVMDSCWETYRLAEWRMDGGRLVITEERMEIPAEVLSASDAELRLRLTLVDGTKEETYRPAPVPYVCPDMPR